MSDVIKRVRNYGYLPYIQEEGEFLKSMPVPPLQPKNKIWYDGLAPTSRMFYHQTLNSARRFALFKPYPFVPISSLDFVIQSQYQHNVEVFPEKIDTILQHETVGEPTFRRIRNTRDLSPQRVIQLGHPLCIGGISERISKHSVKLMNSGPHTPFTNPGYSRQTGDGNFFHY